MIITAQKIQAMVFNPRFAKIMAPNAPAPTKERDIILIFLKVIDQFCLSAKILYMIIISYYIAKQIKCFQIVHYLYDKIIKNDHKECALWQSQTLW